MQNSGGKVRRVEYQIDNKSILKIFLRPCLLDRRYTPTKFKMDPILAIAMVTYPQM